MKKRNFNISEGLRKSKQEPSLLEIANFLFDKVPINRRLTTSKKLKIRESEEKSNDNDLPSNISEDKLLDMEQKNIVEDAWDNNNQRKVLIENHNENYVWIDDQNDLDCNLELEQLQNEKLNYLKGEILKAEGENSDEEDEMFNNSKSFEGEFNLMECISIFLKKNNLPKKLKPDDSDTFLSSSKNSTKEAFSKDLKKFSITHNVNGDGLNSLLSILNQHVPEVNWPMHNNGNSGYVTNDILKYCDEVTTMIEFNICPQHGCCAFVGDYKDYIYCKGCGAERYRKCSHLGCRGINYEDCTHTKSRKISNKSLFYRPITLLIISLLETPGFLRAFNYSFHNKTDTYKYMDCSDGSTYKKNLNEMINHYNDIFKNTETKPIMINFLLGQFYDGCQVYKKKFVVFWPINVIILNLPPSYRVKLGIGMFLISIFTSKAKSNVEDFLLRSLMVEELKSLKEGINVKVNGVNYFVQARMILSILDTIAVEDFLHVQTNQSLAGCFVCHNGKGYNYPLDCQILNII
jgi:hypothetical protein